MSMSIPKHELIKQILSMDSINWISCKMQIINVLVLVGRIGKAILRACTAPRAVQFYCVGYLLLFFQQRGMPDRNERQNEIACSEL